MIAAARRQQEAQLAQQIDQAVEPSLMMRWRTALTAPHGAGSNLQTWLWAPPAKHSSHQIEEMIERIESLYELRVHERMGDFPDDLLRRHARRLAGRPPSAGALIQEPARSVETACFLRYCLLLATDRLLMMVRRQVADLWRRAATGALAMHSDWVVLYQDLLAELGRILADPAAGDGQIREHLHSLLAEHRVRRPASRAELIRARLIDGVRPVRSSLSSLVRLPWAATDNHPVLEALRRLQGLYTHEQRQLSVGTQIFLGRVWQEAFTGADRERAFCAFEVAALLTLRRALRNGTVWIDHSLAFRSRERLFIPPDRWAAQRRSYFRRFGLPTDPAVFLEPLVERAEIGMTAVAAAAKAGTLRVDDELHLTPLASEEEDPEVAKLRIALLGCYRFY